jgi:hypothetical protein
MAWDGQLIEDKKMHQKRNERSKSRDNFSLSQKARDNYDSIDWTKKRKDAK